MPPIPFWAKPRFVFLAILFYLAAHFAIRLALGPALSVDDSEQALFAQHFAWSYRYRAPPLFTWMLLALGQVMPVGVVAIGLLRYALLGATYGFLYLTARRLIADPRLSALAVYSFAAIHTFSEASHRDLTHSTTLAALLAVAWYVFIRLAATRHLLWYLALGATFGLGVLAKWNFAVFAVALPLACLFHRDSRSLVLTWKTLATILLAVLIATPSFIAALRMGPPAGEDIRSVLAARSGTGLAAVVNGTLELLETTLLYAMPLAPIAALVLGLPFARGVRARMAPAAVGPSSPGAGVVGTSIAIGLALLWLLVLALGATEFKVRYVYPVELILPVWLFMVIEAGKPSSRALSVFALILVGLVLEAAAERIAQPFGLVDCGLCMEWRPYKAVAVQLSDNGYRGAGTIVTDIPTGGNLRVLFPTARIVDPRFPLTSWPPPSGEGQCLVLFDDDGNPNARAAATEQIESYLADTLGGDPAAPHRDGDLSAPMLGPAKGVLQLGYRLYDGPVGDCR